jgi:hypothetical protein
MRRTMKKCPKSAEPLPWTVQEPCYRSSLDYRLGLAAHADALPSRDAHCNVGQDVAVQQPERSGGHELVVPIGIRRNSSWMEPAFSNWRLGLTIWFVLDLAESVEHQKTAARRDAFS